VYKLAEKGVVFFLKKLKEINKQKKMSKVILVFVGVFTLFLTVHSIYFYLSTPGNVSEELSKLLDYLKNFLSGGIKNGRELVDELCNFIIMGFF
jgi:hypothetical protein